MEDDDFSEWKAKGDADIIETGRSVLDFAQKMADSKDLPANLIKNIKILKSHVS